MNDRHLPVSVLALQKKAKPLMLPHNPSFEAKVESVNSKTWFIPL